MRHTQADIRDYLDTYKERALATLEKGNRFGAFYMAMLAGMWTHAFHQPNVNPFNSRGEQGELFSFFDAGYRGSEDAIGAVERERRKAIEAMKKVKESGKKDKKAAAALENPYIQGQKESIWNKKLF